MDAWAIYDDKEKTIGDANPHETNRRAGDMSEIQNTGASAPQTNTPQAMTPTDLLARAVQQDVDIDKLERLMDMEARWRESQARIAFERALAEFKADPPQIRKNKHVEFQTNKGKTYYDHATLDHIVDVVAPALSKHGFSHRWSVDQGDAQVRVTCILAHRDGHHESVTMTAAPDQSGMKNSIQQIGSTVSYLQRYTLLAAIGLAPEGADNDARDSETPRQPRASDEQIAKIRELLPKAGRTETQLLQWHFARKEVGNARLEDITAKGADACIKKLDGKVKEAGNADT